MPGLTNTIKLVKTTFNVTEKSKDPKDQKAGNLLDCLQSLTSEGVDFGRERVFETAHPYPQSDYTLSDTIEVPKAIGFVVELDRRCNVDNSSDSLVMYSGSDHIYSINGNFATQIKFSVKPNTNTAYFLLGSRMKLDFRSYAQRRGKNRSAVAHLLADSSSQNGNQGN